MELYSGTSTQFIRESVQNQIPEKLKSAFFDYYRRPASPGEVASWRNSLRAMSQVVQYAGLEDHGILLEYQLPLTSMRIDCIVTGTDGDGGHNAAIVELKQWEKATIAEGDRVMTFVGGGNRDVLHPSAQALQYRTFLQDVHTAFQEVDPLTLGSCAYLHNYGIEASDDLLDPQYQEYVAQVPIFGRDDVDRLTGYLQTRLNGGHGLPVLERIKRGSYRPSRKLMEHVGGVIRGTSAYTLLDDQVIVYDQIFSFLKQDLQSGGKHAIIVKGGPGTGKSVIAINLLADAMKAEFTSNYVTGSKAFTETLRKIVGPRSRPLFRYFNDYTAAPASMVDLLVCDEAHRIRKTSATRYRKGSGGPQVNELLAASRVCLFLIDPHQMVRPDEVGSIEYIREAALKAGVPVREYELAVQFRCAGSDGFVNWINNTLGIERTANVLWEGTESFDFQIMSSVEELDRAIRSKVNAGQTGRITAGFCWPWSEARADGTLADDVVVGDFRRPWNARDEATGLANGVPKSSFWAYEAGGMDQVGCIYTAQGFEFDYVGVIFGRDIYYDPNAAEWKARPEVSHDAKLKRAKENFLQLAKNTYRVLLSRGMKGCYVHFMDRDTENFFRSRMGKQAK